MKKEKIRERERGGDENETMKKEEREKRELRDFSLFVKLRTKNFPSSRRASLTAAEYLQFQKNEEKKRKTR